MIEKERKGERADRRIEERNMRKEKMYIGCTTGTNVIAHRNPHIFVAYGVFSHDAMAPDARRTLHTHTWCV
jgi:hypothetical protein